MPKRLTLMLAALAVAAAVPAAVSHAQGHGRAEGHRLWLRQGMPPPRDDGPPRFLGQRYDAPRPDEPRPGRFLPPQARGAPVEDLHRYRLRPPPHGFSWRRIGGSYALVSDVDGRVFDVAPPD